MFARFRRPRPPLSPDDLVTVDLGIDVFRNEMIATILRARGVQVEILVSGAGGLAPHWAYAQPHRLLVRRGDLDVVHAVVEDAADLDLELLPDADPLDQDIPFDHEGGPASADQGGSST
jgi:hypothetical protein